MTSWFGSNATEPFSAGFRSLDFQARLRDDSFLAERFFRGQREAVYLKGQLPPITVAGSIYE